MGKVTGFLELERVVEVAQPPRERVGHYREFVLALAERGATAALRHDPHLRAGLNVHRGQVTHPGVARALGMAAVDPLTAIG